MIFFVFELLISVVKAREVWYLSPDLRFDSVYIEKLQPSITT